MDAGALAGWQPSPRYPDPAVQIVDERFARYRLANAKVERLATGLRWARAFMISAKISAFMRQAVPHRP